MCLLFFSAFRFRQIGGSVLLIKHTDSPNFSPSSLQLTPYDKERIYSRMLFRQHVRILRDSNIGTGSLSRKKK